MRKWLRWQHKSIWALPITTFKPAVKEFDTCTLDEEDAELTGTVYCEIQLPKCGNAGF